MRVSSRRLLIALSLSSVLAGSRASAEYALTTLATFSSIGSESPGSDLAADSAGNLYGTTGFHGINTSGVYEIAAGTHVLTNIATLNSASGFRPVAGLAVDANGNLYGTGNYGGSSNLGAVFKVDASTHAVSAVASFNGANGARPHGQLLLDAGGNLFGTTYAGGANDLGTVFEIAANTHEITTLATFDGSNGIGPNAGLVADSRGNLFGTTSGGDLGRAGTVFEISADTHTLSTLVTFNASNGWASINKLLIDSSGNLYGTTYGTLFKVDAATHGLTTLATFNDTNGTYPHGELIADSSGNLYGTTYQHSDFGLGTVFKFDVVTNELTTLVSFDDSNGACPIAGVYLDGSGNLFGTTTGNFGVLHRDGTVFELTPVPEPPSLQLCLLGFFTLCILRSVRVAAGWRKPQRSIETTS